MQAPLSVVVVGILGRIELTRRRAMPRTRRLAEISDATTLQMLDDLGGNYPELVVVPRHAPPRPELAGLAKRLLDIEQEFLL